jgi:hypothetical protein
MPGLFGCYASRSCPLASLGCSMWQVVLCCFCCAEARSTPPVHLTVVCWWFYAAGNSKDRYFCPQCCNHSLWGSFQLVHSAAPAINAFLPGRICSNPEFIAMCRHSPRCTLLSHDLLCRPCQWQLPAASSNATRSSSSNTSRSIKSSQTRHCRRQRQQAYEAEAQPARQQRWRWRQWCNTSTNASTCVSCCSCSCPSC